MDPLHSTMCVICGTEQPRSHFPSRLPTKKCHHSIQSCSECIDKWCRGQLDRGLDTFACPICRAAMSEEDLKALVGNSTFKRSVKAFSPSDGLVALFNRVYDLPQSANMKLRYKEVSHRKKMEATPDFHWCQNPQCKAGQIHEELQKPLKCNLCWYKSCVSCGGAWHEGRTCAQNMEKRQIRQSQHGHQEKQADEIVSRISRKCPGKMGKSCGAKIEKGGGCDEMRCSRCGARFCWYGANSPHN